MSNGTKDSNAELLHEQLATLVAAYRGILRNDERQLQEAMLAFERSCRQDRRIHAA